MLGVYVGVVGSWLARDHGGDAAMSRVMPAHPSQNAAKNGAPADVGMVRVLEALGAPPARRRHLRISGGAFCGTTRHLASSAGGSGATTVTVMMFDFTTSEAGSFDTCSDTWMV